MKKISILFLLIVLFSLPLNIAGKEYISGTVYKDSNINGKFDKNEKTLANIKIKMYNSSNKLITSTSTNKKGYYKMEKTNKPFYLKLEKINNKTLDINTSNNYTNANNFKSDMYTTSDSKINIGYANKSITNNKSALGLPLNKVITLNHLFENANITNVITNNNNLKCTHTNITVNCLAEVEGIYKIKVAYIDNYKRTNSADFVITAATKKVSVQGKLQLNDIYNKRISNNNLTTTLTNFSFKLLDSNNNLITTIYSKSSGDYQFKDLYLPYQKYKLVATNNNTTNFRFSNNNKLTQNKNIVISKSNNNIDFDIVDIDIPSIKITSNRTSNGFNPTYIKVSNLEDASTKVSANFKITNLSTKHVYKSDKLTIPKNDGKYEIQYYAIDASKNKSIIKKHEFTIDNTKPIIYFKVKNIDDYPHIKMSASDNLDSNIKINYQVMDNSNNIVINSNSSEFDNNILKSLSNNKYTISISATDLAGNSASYTSKKIALNNKIEQNTKAPTIAVTNTPTLINSNVNKDVDSLIILLLLVLLLAVIQVYRFYLNKRHSI
ncbi:SdrD B-like domain-containing protein [Mycoplasma sp. P36-A1]|uniref:SdrD B-like domain-containing protein n=1 Tax=Mycoplasma sp. P36-A1 TaxID=3252900 RepID=UPI003C3005E5